MCKQYTCSCEFILMLITFTYKFIIIMLICRGAATDSGSPGQHIFELVTWHTTKYGDPYSEFVLCIWPILSAHTQQWTHTRSSGQPFMLRRPGSSWGFRCLAQGHLSRGIEGGESAVHSLPPPTIPAGPRLELTIFRLRVRLSNH